MNFVAMDFETANGSRYSACSLALAVVRNDKIVDELYSLINPHVPFYWRNVHINGIHEKDVANAPEFPELWDHIKQFYRPDQLVIAHNNSFDNNVLKNTLLHYEITPPTYLTLDTVKTSRAMFPSLPNHKLNTVADALQIDLHHHHNALDDAQACANILLYQENKFGPASLKPYIRRFG